METMRLSLDSMIERFDIELLEEADAFLAQLPLKSREKVLYNMRKARAERP